MCLNLSDEIAAVSLLVALVSLIVAVWSVIVGKQSLKEAQDSAKLAQDSLKQAQNVAERERNDWNQRKWFELYVKSNDVYDLLNKFQATYAGPDRTNANSTEYRLEFNELIMKFRDLQMLAIVYPQIPPVKKIIEATTGLKDSRESMFDPHRLELLMEVLKDLLEKAQIRTGLL
jgi:hypothetical protein